MEPSKINNFGDVFKHLGEIMKPPETIFKTSDLFKTVSIPSVLSHGETEDSCFLCDEPGTKEVTYYQEFCGQLEKHREILCEDCLSDYYWIGKTIVSIMPYKSEEQKRLDEDYDNRMFTEN